MGGAPGLIGCFWLLPELNFLRHRSATKGTTASSHSKNGQGFMKHYPPAIKSSKRSVTPGFERCGLARGEMAMGCSNTNVGWTKDLFRTRGGNGMLYYKH
eukprot:1161955-Pelagomonas_calceolata.AAC.3